MDLEKSEYTREYTHKKNPTYIKEEKICTLKFKYIIIYLKSSIISLFPLQEHGSTYVRIELYKLNQNNIIFILDLVNTK